MAASFLFLFLLSFLALSLTQAQDYAPRNSVLAVAVTSDGRFLAGAHGDGNVVLWNVATREEKHLACHAVAEDAMAFNPKGSLLAMGDEHGNVLVFSIPEGKLQRTLNAGNGTGRVMSIKWAQQQPSIAAVSTDQDVTVWDVSTGQPLFRFPSNGSPIALSPGSDLLALGDEQGKVSLWDLRTRKLLYDHPEHTQYVTDLAFDTSGNLLASSSGDKTVVIEEASSGKLVSRLIGHNDEVLPLAFNSSGDLISVGGDRQVITWSIHSGKALGRWAAPDFGALALSANGRWLAFGGTNGVAIWSVVEAREVTHFAYRSQGACEPQSHP